MGGEVCIHSTAVVRGNDRLKNDLGLWTRQLASVVDGLAMGHDLHTTISLYLLERVRYSQLSVSRII